MSAITIQYIDGSLLSGSTDLLRTYLEKSYEVETTDAGDQSIGFNVNVDYYDSDGSRLTMVPHIKNVLMDVDEITTLTGSAIIPSYRVPIRVTANSEYITKNAYWDAFVNGGNIEGAYYEGFYSTAVHSDHYIECSVPYGGLEAATLGQFSDTGYESISITPSYNYYLPEYESYIGELTEGLIPNIYNYQAAYDVFGTTEEIQPDILQYITLDHNLENLMEFGPDASGENIAALLQLTKHQPLPPEESLYLGYDDDGDSTDDYMVDRNYNLRTYLTGAFPTAAISGSTLTVSEGLHENILFNSTNTSEYLTQTSAIVSNTRDLFPLYNTINIPASLFEHSSVDFSSTSVIRDIIEDNEYSSYFINSLRAAHSNSANLDTVSFLTYTTYLESDEDTETNSTVESVSTAGLPSMDLVNFLMNSRDLQYLDGAPTSAAYFVGSQTYNIKSAITDDVPYSFQNSIKSARVLESVIDELSGLAFPLGVESIDQFYEYADSSKYYEVLAFRVEKLDEFGTKICDYWVYNGTDIENIIVTDTQIKYGKAYTYNVFAYKLVVGIKYKLGDLIISEKMGDTSTSETSVTDGDTTTDEESSETSESEEACSCMRWTIPGGVEVSAALARSSPFDLGEDDDGYFTTTDDEAWQADMYLYYEPSAKIIEIPIFTKILKNEDNPPQQLDIIPFQKIDNSQKIGFKIRYKAFAKQYSPDILSPTEETYILDYYSGRDKLSNEKITQSSRSRADTIEVYRMEEKPTSISDFTNHLLKSYDLRFNSPGTTTFVVCEDTVHTNKIYYYAFRAINSHGIAGQMTEIYESELRSDGGYNYSVFNVIHKTDLTVDRFTNPSKSFKKLINLKPNIRHLSINSDNVDYGEASYSQVSNLTLGDSDEEDTIWGKTFKIRLTSKKTGKKIDLNITYNLENG